jgi:HAD superfamily hydrolase (TIGR01549 family)
MIKLALFDMDGTIFESHLDWLKIRRELRIEKSGNILKEIYKDGGVDEERLQKLENYEKENTLKTKPIRGISDFLGYLGDENITTVLITNNNRENTDYLLNKFNLNFGLVITREMKLWKPAPDAFLYAMARYQCKSDETIVIGDSHYDVGASRRARVPHIFIIKNSRVIQLIGSRAADVTYFGDYLELKAILERFNG